MKTLNQIDDMQFRLVELVPTLERFNEHGESNWEALKCQIAALEHKLNEDDCWNQWPTHHQEQDQYNRERALEAVKWLWEEGEDLVELWQRERIMK